MTSACSTEVIARVVHAANTELQRAAGEPLSLLWDSETEETRQVTIAGVEAAAAGRTPEELHAEWCRKKAAAGWKRGPVKDSGSRTHPSLVPYSELPEAERLKDRLLGAITRTMSQPEGSSALEESGVIAMVLAEYARAKAKHGEYTLDGSAISDLRRLAALVEETGEVAEMMTYDKSAAAHGDGDYASRLKKELIQVANVSLTWASIL